MNDMLYTLLSRCDSHYMNSEVPTVKCIGGVNIFDMIGWCYYKIEFDDYDGRLIK